jgi:ADP-ribose pyrophosphatase YjhB (NUDIX family)
MSVSPRAYQETLPKKRMGAGALFQDAAGRVLLVKPTYKPQWEIPGGIVEQDESPRQACRREVQEELGLMKRLERLLSISYIASTVDRLEGLMFIFAGGILSNTEIAAITLPEQELSAYCFVEPATLGQYLTPSLTRRVECSLEVVNDERTLYLE